MGDLVFAIQREIEALEKAEGLTAQGASWWVHGIMLMINRVIESLDPAKDAKKITALYYQAESAYLLAAEKITVGYPEESDWLRHTSTAYLMLAHQCERQPRVRRD